jgi:hypothetical protein
MTAKTHRQMEAFSGKNKNNAAAGANTASIAMSVNFPFRLTGT